MTYSTASRIFAKRQRTLQFEGYLGDRLAQLATERALEIISGGVHGTQMISKPRLREIPWRKDAGIGNVLRHDYRDAAPEIN